MKFYFIKINIISLLLGFICFFLILTSSAQEKANAGSVYSINKKWEIPLTLGMFGTNFVGLQYVGKKTGLDSLDIIALNPADLWGIDQKATQQDPAFAPRAHHISDWALNISVALPVFLGLDKKIRKDWFDLIVLYGETHAINGNLYIAAASLVDRPRPLVYNPGVLFNQRSENGTLNSFFSGHVSTAAASSFFTAKVYSDYHPEMGNKKYFLFGAAVIPPLVVGFYRYKAMKHFPTDIFTGMLVGATTGILVPHINKKINNYNLSIVPFTGQANGVRLVLNL